MRTELMKFQDNLAIALFGETLQSAISKNICIACKSPVEPQDWGQLDIDEYNISGLCPTCFNDITTGD